MAVNVGNATYGYDASGVQSFVNKLQTTCITDTINSIMLGLNDLNRAVDAAWQGASAEAFKKRMDTDADTVKNGLKEAEATMLSTISSVAQGIAEVDESIQF